MILYTLLAIVALTSNTVHGYGIRYDPAVAETFRSKVNVNSILSKPKGLHPSVEVVRTSGHNGSSITTAQNPTEAIVEILVVCDKEFGDKFQHDRTKILDYLTVYFWDMNLRYKTMPGVTLSFHVTGVVIIASPQGQPFIEEARAEDGRAEFGRILYRFTDWVEENQASFPKFDVAVCITNTQLEWGGGLAFVNAACLRHGTGVFNDAGDWGSLTVGTHEIAHILGAPHDESVPGCTASGYIMSGGNDELKWYFSWCSDQTVGDYVRSDQAACLRRIDENGLNPISPDFSAVSPPPMPEQCRNIFGATAYMEDQDLADCKKMRCLVPDGGTIWIHNRNTADNTPCAGGGRCFRGRCRQPANLIQNVGTGMCMRAPNPFAFTVTIEMIECPQPGTPLDRFLVSDGPNGKLLANPWSNADATEVGDRCIYTGNAEGNGLSTDRCSETNPWHGWNFVDLGNEEFLLQHQVSQRCAKQVGNGISTHQNCDRNDASMKWRLQ